MGQLIFLRPEVTADYESAVQGSYLSTLRASAGDDIDSLMVLRGQACQRDPATLGITARARVRGVLKALSELIEQATLNPRRDEHG